MNGDGKLTLTRNSCVVALGVLASLLSLTCGALRAQDGTRDAEGVPYDAEPAWRGRSSAMLSEAQKLEQQGDLEGARKIFVDRLAGERERFPERHWRTINARIDLEELDVRRELDDAQRERLAEEARLTDEGQKLVRARRGAEALPLAKQSLSLIGEVLGEKNRTYAFRLNNVGAAYGAMQEPRKAAEYVERAAVLMESVLGPDHWRTAELFNALAAIYKTLGEFSRCEQILVRVRDINVRALGPQHWRHAASMNNLADTYSSLGEFDKSEELNLKALLLNEQTVGKRHRFYFGSLNNLAGLYLERGDFVRAEPLLMEAIELGGEIFGEDSPEQSVSLNTLASLYGKMGDDVRAEELFKRSRDIRKAKLPPGHPFYARAVQNLGSLYLEAGKHDLAEPLFVEAADLRKRVLGPRHPEYADTLYSLGRVHELRGRKDRALQSFERALVITRDSLGEHHVNYADRVRAAADFLRRSGDLERADALLAQAMETNRRALGDENPRYLDCLLSLAHLRIAQGRKAEAVKLLRENLAGSRRHLTLASMVQSERQQLAMVGGAREVLDSFLSLALGESSSTNEIYGHVVAWKGSVFRRQRRARLLAARDENAALYRELERVSSRLAALALRPPNDGESTAWNAERRRLRDLHEKLEGDLARRSAKFRTARERAALEPATLAKLLPPDTSFIDFLEYEQLASEGSREDEPGRRLVAFVLRRDRPVRSVDLGRLPPIERAVEAWRQALLRELLAREGKGSDARGLDGLGAELRSRIWEPLREAIGSARTVIVSPDGVLSRLPLAALPGKSPGSYLIEERAIGVVAAASALPDVLEPVSGSASLDSSLVLVGDVDFDTSEPTLAVKADASESEDLLVASAPRGAAFGADRPNWERLAFTRTEIASLESTFQRAKPEGSVRRLVGAGASEAAFREAAPKSSYVHLATHGFFASAETKSALGSKNLAGWSPGLLSGIVFSGANRSPGPDAEDGILTALELAPIDLSRTELLVLSACETGLGKTAGGEGLLGIQRAAQVAGADAVVASLWRVGDADTAALMGRFYENLWKRGLPKLEALREAQIALLRGVIESGSSRRLRGPGGTKKLPKGARLRVSPQAWAAWVLSGDWR